VNKALNKTIAFTGIDGSGKTVIARTVATLLLKRRFKVKILWIKSLHTLAYLIYCFFRKTWGIEYIVNPRNRVVEHFATQYMEKMGKLWGLVEFISIIPWILVANILKHINYIVICDRYLADFLATVSLRVGDPLWWAKSIIGKFLLTLQSKTQTIHLKISLSTALKRRPDIEYSLNELKTLIAIYRVIAETVNAVEVVNENRDLKEVLEEVIRRIRLTNPSSLHGVLHSLSS